MKMKFLKYALLLLLPAGMLLSSCSKDDDDDAKLSGITVKCGKITYSNNSYFAFKDYGKMYAWGKGSTKFIFDVNASKVYAIDLDTRTYVENSGSANIKLYSGNIVANELVWLLVPGLNKTTATIAGKPCTIYSWTNTTGTYTYGAWNGLVFKVNDITDNFEATSFDDAEPAASMFSLDGLIKVTDI